jgi:hypothetical protein
MNSTLPLYRQLSRYFYLLALAFLLLLIAGFSLYFQHQKALNVFKYQQIPTIEKYNQQKLLLISHQRLINELLSRKYAADLDDDYQTLIGNINNISALSSNNRQLLEQLSQSLQKQAENVTRLTESDRRSIQLKDNVIIQLTLVTDYLADLITKQTRQQQDLYRQISQGSLTKKATTTKVKTLNKLINHLQINRELQHSLIAALMMFNQLDLQYDLVDFDYIQQTTEQQISYWFESASQKVVSNPSESALLEQISVLSALLFTEQSTFAKWRGQLRRVKDFHDELTKQKNALIPLLDKTLTFKPLKLSFIDQQLRAWLAKVNINLQPQHDIWFVTVIFALLSLIFISLLLGLQRTIKRFGEQSTKVVDEFVSEGEVLTTIPGVEVQEIINAIKKLAKPRHSEADFQRQQQQHEQYVALMSRHSGHVFWQLPQLPTAKQKQLSALLGINNFGKHWRQYFSRVDVHTILSSARKVKKNHGIERLTLISNQEKAIVLTIEYLDGVWCGSLCDAEDYRVLKDENRQLQQQLKQQNQEDKLAIVASCEDVSALLSKVMLQQQMRSIARGDERLANQQLRQLMSRTEQQKTSAQLRQDDFVLTFSAVKLANELHTALANVSLHQAPHDNLIYLKLAENIASWVTLESDLFQSMISTICQKMLMQQHGVELNIELKVIDVNSAQQMVRFSFLVNQPSNAEALSQVLNTLAFDDELSGCFDNVIDNYLRDLQLVFNVSHKISQQLTNAGKFCFDLPLATAEAPIRQVKTQTTKLAKCRVLVIATKKSSRERISQQLANTQAVVDTMQDLSLFQRQISIAHLTTNHLDAMILSPEVYSTDYDLITQHLASLPSKLQPKVLVVQPLHCKELQRAGFFSVSNWPWFNDELMTDLAELLKSEQRTNKLIEPEIFLPYKYLSTEVEVLLGVSTSNKQQVLIRILRWLGLQVTVVSQQERLERLWQSGRYLVVIAEFLPLKCKITDASKIVRGVFYLSHTNGSHDSFVRKLNLPEFWHSGYLPSVLDIQKLAQQLSPWLKLATGKGEHKASQVLQAKCGNKITKKVLSKQQVVKVDVDEMSALKVVDIEQSLDSVLNLEQEAKQIAEAFDLTQYAQNQGSAELAAFMLDEYLAEISTNIHALEKAFATQDYPLMNELLTSLNRLAKVIAANGLLTQCRQLGQLLDKSFAHNDVSVAQKQPLQERLNDLKLSLVQLTEFAESI